jgi:VCBS repeat-containing protein
LTYSIASDDANKWSIDSATGTVTLKAGQALNREQQDEYLLTVRVTDGTFTVDQPLQIDIEDENDVPVFLDASGSVREDASVGSVVMTVVASDQDPGTDLDFSIVGGNGDGVFGVQQVDTTTAQLTIASTANLDHETTDVYTLTVRATDDGFESGSATTHADATITVTIVDVNEAPVITPGQTRSVDENTDLPSAFDTKLVLTEPDEGQSHFWSLRGGHEGAFTIDGDGQLRVAGPLDKETKDTYTVTVRATDNGAPALFDETTITVTINNVNEAPNFPRASWTPNLHIDENVAAGTVVTGSPVQGDDIDHGSTSDRDTLQYAIVDGPLSDKFRIQSSGANRGQLSLAAGQSLDHEATPEILLVIEVTDAGELTGRGSVTVMVDDVNETPVFPHPDIIASAGKAQRGVREDVGGSADVGLPVYGFDVDDDTLSYTITGGNGSSLFAIDSSTGQITVAPGMTTPKLVGEETQRLYELEVTADDRNGESNMGIVQVYVSDTNVAPTLSDVTLSFAEDTTATSAIVTIGDFMWIDFDVMNG